MISMLKGYDKRPASIPPHVDEPPIRPSACPYTRVKTHLAFIFSAVRKQSRSIVRFCAAVWHIVTTVKTYPDLARLLRP